MKLVLFCLLSFMALTSAVPPVGGRGCIYIMGKCRFECGEGTHGYSSGCNPKVPEPTCDEPNPVAEDVIICDYSACYCDPPTVRDTVSKKCVNIKDCPDKV